VDVKMLENYNQMIENVPIDLGTLIQQLNSNLKIKNKYLN